MFGARPVIDSVGVDYLIGDWLTQNDRIGNQLTRLVINKDLVPNVDVQFVVRSFDQSIHG